MQRIRRHIAALALLTCIAPMLGMTAAQAQTDWPKRNMKVVVPYPAGGSADAMGRMVANKLAKAFPKVSVVVENIPGGATVPGALAVLRDAADGHTLFMASDGTLNINRWLLKDVRYDADRDFTPVTVLNSYPHWLIVNPQGPYKSLDDLVKAIRAKPGKVSISINTIGGSAHLALDNWRRENGLDFAIVPYRGSPPAVTDLIGGHTDAQGSEAFNAELSRRRAQAVVDYLVKDGIPASKLSAAGYGETRPVATNETAEGKARVWRARSAFGQPGLDTSRGMAVAESFAAALDAGKPIRVWNAGGADALRIDLDSVDVTLAPKVQAGPEHLALLAPRTALPLALPSGDKKLEIDLGPDTAAFAAPGENDRLALAAVSGALARMVATSANEIWLVNTSDQPQPVRVVSAPGKPEILTQDRIAKRFFGAAGSTAMRVEAAKGDVLRVEGAEATWLSQSGSILRGASLIVDGPGELTLDYQPGLVAAWIERGGASPWPKAEARALAPPVSTKLEGAAMAFALKPDKPSLVGLRSSAPVAVALEQNGRRELKLFAAGADFHRYVAAGDATISVYSPHDGPLSGALDVILSPVTPARDGIGDPVALSPGASMLFGFEVKRAGEIGVGLRAEPDRVEARLLDASGKLVGEGLAQIVKLEPGRYFLEARAPVDTSATILRPALIGLDPPPAGPPPEEIAKYLAAAGLKTNSKAQ